MPQLKDGFLSLEGGVDAGFAPGLLDINQNAWAVNTTHRGGWPTCRPGFIKRAIDFSGQSYIQEAVESGRFQGAGTYTADDGRSYLALAVSGRTYLVDITRGFRLREITIQGDPNLATRPHVWFQQAENWLIWQDGISRAGLYNGSTSRRAADQEVPVGGPMAYGKGRLWVARGSEYFGGDLVNGDPDYGRDNVLRFTENTVIAEGGAFRVQNGPVTGLAFAANIDSALGVQELLVATPTAVYAFDAPIDRTTWQDLQYPLQKYAVLKFGSLNHESMVNMNGDLIYRSIDGVRSIAYAQRDFESWGNAPISRQIARALKYDSDFRLGECSAVNFDNRLLMTTQPQLARDRGTWHRGLVVLDYHLVTGMGKKLNPAWEGVWTGLRILRLITVEVGTVTRCFVYALSEENRLELWELSKTREFDHDGSDDVPIRWSVEMREMSFGEPELMKRVYGGKFWVDGILGSVSADVVFRFDGSECWKPWARWSDCVKYRSCETDAEACDSYPYQSFIPIHNFKAQKRAPIGLGEPPDTNDPETELLSRQGYGLQMRFDLVGKFRLRRLKVMADETGDDDAGDLSKTSCLPVSDPECQEDCGGIECCEPDDYDYRIDGGDDAGETEPEYPVEGGGGDDEDETPTISFDPSDPFGEPPPDNPPPPGFVASVYASAYGFGLNPWENPNQSLSPDRIAKGLCIFADELSRGGYTVASGYRWVFYPTGATNSFFSADLRPTCDTSDGQDPTVGGSVAAYIAVAIYIPA